MEDDWGVSLLQLEARTETAGSLEGTIPRTPQVPTGVPPRAGPGNAFPDGSGLPKEQTWQGQTHATPSGGNSGSTGDGQDGGDLQIEEVAAVAGGATLDDVPVEFLPHAPQIAPMIMQRCEADQKAQEER